MRKKLEHSELDFGREARTGMEEVVFGGSKSVPEVLEIVNAHLTHLGKVLCTRLTEEHLHALAASHPHLICYPRSGIVHSPIFESGAADSAKPLGEVAVVSAGTSDGAVAEEAAVVAKYLGCSVTRVNDVGVAGIERLLDRIPQLNEMDVLIVVAGMEGALPGVVAGLTGPPVIAVPTSVGYGATFQGMTAFLSMLVSCSPGMSVVNIDNGFGAAVVAARWLRHLRRRMDL